MSTVDWNELAARALLVMLIASRFGVEPRSIPAEAVWFLCDGPVTDADRQRAKELAEELGLSS